MHTFSEFIKFLRNGWEPLVGRMQPSGHQSLLEFKTPCFSLCILHYSYCYWEMWQILKLTVTSHSITQHCRFLLTASFLHLSVLFLLFFFLREFTIPMNTYSCPALPALWNKGLIGWCRAVVTLLSSNQSFRQLLSHLPPCSFPSLSSSLFSSPRTCLSSGTSFSGCWCWQHVGM